MTRRIRARSAGAHYQPVEDLAAWPRLTAAELVAAALVAVGVIVGVAWFLTAFPVPS